VYFKPWMRGAAGYHRVRAAVRTADAVHLFLKSSSVSGHSLDDTLPRGVRPSDQADVDPAHQSTGDAGAHVDYYFESPRAAAERV
jgi:hypothetical protein